MSGGGQRRMGWRCITVKRWYSIHRSLTDMVTLQKCTQIISSWVKCFEMETVLKEGQLPFPIKLHMDWCACAGWDGAAQTCTPQLPPFYSSAPWHQEQYFWIDRHSGVFALNSKNTWCPNIEQGFTMIQDTRNFYKNDNSYTMVNDSLDY